MLSFRIPASAHYVSYLFTGVFSTVMCQVLSYQGLDDQKTLILAGLNYIGMFSVAFLPGWVFGGGGSNKVEDVEKDDRHSGVAEDGGKGKGGKGVYSSEDSILPNPNDDMLTPRVSVKGFEHTSNDHEEGMGMGMGMGMGEDIALLAGEGESSSSSVPSEAQSPLHNHNVSSRRHRSTTTTPNYLSNDNNGKKKMTFVHRLPLGAAVNLMIACDFLGSVLGMIGLSWAGSGIYMTIHSSIVCWAALLSVIFLGKELGKTAWVSLFVIMFGLVCSAASQGGAHGAHFDRGILGGDTGGEQRGALQKIWDERSAVIGNFTGVSRLVSGEGEVGGVDGARRLFGAGSDDLASETKELHTTFLGMFMTLIGSWCFAFNYILAETVQTLPGAPTGKELAEKCGAVSTMVCGVYMCFYTFPEWDRVVEDRVIDAGGDWGIIVVCSLALMTSQMIHAVNYFNLVKNAGAVSVGVLQSCRAISTFAISALLFCERQASQCFTVNRGISSVIVSGGILLYSNAKAKKPKR